MSGIRVEGLSFSYEENPVLKDLHFEIRSGESVGLVGANGAGKSTLLRVLVGLVRNYTGQAFVGDFSVEKKQEAAIRRICGYVFQDSDSQLFMSTVGQDVAFGPHNYGLSAAEAEARAEEALLRVRIPHLKDQAPFRLSGGEKKLAAIATILAMDPEIILFDEPSAALDPKNRRNLIGILQELPQTKLIASHDLDFILDCCQRCLLLDGGRLIADGPAEQVLYDRALLEAHGLELPLSAQ